MSPQKITKVLITGGTGYIGNYISKILAATHPEITVYSLSRRSVQSQRERDAITSRFSNIEFV